jgi:L-aminopeptidase/D-esterase-like protein
VPAKPVRARDLGIPLEGKPGSLNAITDVAGVQVGHTTLISGKGKLQVGKGPVRTGVTALLPRGGSSCNPCFVGWFSLNGNGEMTGTTWVEESGLLAEPVLLTNTASVGTVRDAAMKWMFKQFGKKYDNMLPVVAETWDGYLNDIQGFHVKEEHVFAALHGAKGGPVREGNVGGGTGMICFEFAGGIGTSSRTLRVGKKSYTLGALVQANFGLRHQLRIAGVPVGQEIKGGTRKKRESGSIIVLIATDAPLLPHQLKRLARRTSLGLARTGSISGNSSGDIFLAFSTAHPGMHSAEDAAPASGHVALTMVVNEEMDKFFKATVEAAEEAILNALVAARIMTGQDDHTVEALPHERVREILKEYHRLSDAK